PNCYLQGRILSVRRMRERRAEAYLYGDVYAEKRKEYGDDGEDPRWCRIDVQATQPAARGENLNVELKPEHPEYAPGSTPKVEMRVTDRKGQAVEAELSLGAVDESVYAFGEDRVGALSGMFSDPHPPHRFYPKAWRASVGFRKKLLEEETWKQDMAISQLRE